LARLIGLGIGFVVLGLVFWALESRFRSTCAPIWFRRKDFRTDLAYWFFTPLVSRSLTAGVVGAALLGVVWLSGGSPAAVRDQFLAGRVPTLGSATLAARLAALPFWLQVGLGLLVSDTLSYWMHRAFHGGRLWGLHAVHHASPNLDWLSSVRLHPLNQAAMRVVQALPLLFLGFDPHVFAVVAPFISFYAILIHANVPWDFGPLRFLVATPRFHRWHHTSRAEGRDKNFAGLFPCLDLVFGSFYMPSDQVPQAFGAGREPVPAGLWRQLAYPFRKPRAGEALASEQR